MKDIHPKSVVKASSRRLPPEVAILGGGSFGTALAVLLEKNRRRTILWVRRAAQAREINQKHTNRDYFPRLKLPPPLVATDDLPQVLSRARIVLMAVPSENFRGVARQLGECLKRDQILLHATKGLEPKTFKRMSQILREETGASKLGVLSGPNLAAELMAGHPSGATVASHDDEAVKAAQELFYGSPLRLYGSRDVVGVEIGGAFKNIIALISGAAYGLGFGDNTKALIVTRGLAEMTRYGLSQGAKAATFNGLAGIGDLLATCTSPLSRNFRAGMRLARGESIQRILQSSSQVVEGVPTAFAVYHQNKKLGLDLPMVHAVYRACFEKKKIRALLQGLMDRPARRE